MNNLKLVKNSLAGDLGYMGLSYPHHIPLQQASHAHSMVRMSLYNFWQSDQSSNHVGWSFMFLCMQNIETGNITGNPCRDAEKSRVYDAKNPVPVGIVTQRKGEEVQEHQIGVSESRRNFGVNHSLMHGVTFYGNRLNNGYEIHAGKIKNGNKYD